MTFNVKGTTKNLGQKDLLDRFYTNEEVAKQCISHVDLDEFEVIIEPSAGGGAFFSNIDNCIGYDVAPCFEGIIKEDWFNVDKGLFKGKKSLVIGNPPFGQQNSIAIKFFNESAAFAEVIAFILPLSFKKDSVKNRLDLNFHLVKEVDLEENSFHLFGEEKSVPCVFQIWERKSTPRKKIRLRTTSEILEFTDRENADLRVQRVGGNAGKASFDFNRAVASNYFIKNKTEKSNEELKDFINSLIFPSIEFTVGPKSLSKGELIAIIEENL